MAFENIPKDLTQSGALRVANPMEAYQNALQTKGLEQKVQGNELDAQGKMLDILKGSIPLMKDPQDLQKFKDYYSRKFPGAFSMDKLPTENDFGPGKPFATFEDWQAKATSTAGELLRLKMGQPATISKVNADG